MRVLYWTPRFWPDIGGIEVMAARTLPALREHGYDLLVMASHASSDPPVRMDYQGIPVFTFPFWAALVHRDLRLVHQLRQEVTRLKRDFQPDLIHVNFSGYTAYFQVTTADVSPAPTLIALRSSLAGQAAGADTMLGQLLRSANWIAAASRAIQNDAIRIVPEIATHCSVIYDGLQPPTATPLPLPFDPPRIVCVGRLHREKGFDLVIQALPALMSRYPGLGLTVVGDGPERGALQQQAASLGLGSAVEFTGAVHNDLIPQLLNAATVAIIPSRVRDAFPIVALEAAFMGRPIIAANTGGLPEAVAAGETGLLVEVGSSRAIAEAVTFLLDHPALTRRMGAAGRARAFELFSMHRCITAYDRLYHRLGQRENSPGVPQA